MEKRYRVVLSLAEREELRLLVSRGKSAARKQTRARILLMCDESTGERRTDREVAGALSVGRATVERVRRRCVEEGLESALNPRKQLRRRRKVLDGEAEARLVAIACGEPPEGRARWTLRLLADRLVELEVVESVGTETVRQTLKKNRLKPWLKECWCIPPKQDAGYVAAMEDVLDVYQREFEEDEVLVCMDEAGRQHVKETREPLPARPGDAGKQDCEYERNGTSNLFMLFAPLLGWRRVEVTERRARADWARAVKQLADEDFPGKRIVLVMDNLNTHAPGSLYAAFEPAEARRIARRLEIHYTPRHGSWLNMAETEIGAMARQCLNRRIPDRDSLIREVGAWQEQRNRESVRVDWRFTTDDARIRLKSLYPSIQSG